MLQVFDLKQGKVDDFNRVFFINPFFFSSKTADLKKNPPASMIAFKSIFLF
jgi:hypothetical protein